MRRLLSLLTALAAACGGAPTAPQPITIAPPVLLSASDSQVAVGQTLSFYGGSFLNDKGHVELQFQGQFVHQGGAGQDPVNFSVRPSWTSGNQVDWQSFGPFWIPFGDGRTLGTFQGTVSAINMGDDGTQAASTPLGVQLQVMPSIIIDSFQPVTASGCPGPIKRLLGGFPYQLTVEAIGFTPVNFTYLQISPDFTPPPLRHPAQGNADTFGQNNELYFPPVPDQQTFYVAQFAVEAMGTDGNTYGVTYGFGVHKPIEYIPTGPAQVAEYEAPVPVGGCIPGNQFGGQDVTYTDTQTDDRTRNVSYSWDQNWQKSQEQSQMSGVTMHNGVNLSVDNSTNSSYSAGWSVGQDSSHSTSSGWSKDYGSNSSNTNGTERGGSLTVNGNADVGVPGLGQVGGGLSTTGHYSQNASNQVGQSYNQGSNGSVQDSMSKSVGLNGSQEMGQSQARTVGSDHSRDDTESWGLSQSNSYTVSNGGSSFWQVSSSTSIAVGSSYKLLPGYDGWWYRQTTRLAYPGEVISYDLCGQPTVAASAYFYDYVWAVALAYGTSCSVNNMPTPSSFPPAQCTIGCANN